MKLKLKSGENIVLDFNQLTFLECTLYDKTYKLGTTLIDATSEKYIIERILFETIILKDSEDTLYSFPKEEIIKFKLVEL